jgi:hypothetical protein
MQKASAYVPATHPRDQTIPEGRRVLPPANKKELQGAPRQLQSMDLTSAYKELLSWVAGWPGTRGKGCLPLIQPALSWGSSPPDPRENMLITLAPPTAEGTQLLAEGLSTPPSHCGLSKALAPVQT